MSAILDFFTPQVLVIIGIVILIQIIATYIRYYVVLHTLKQNEKELEATLQHSEGNIRKILMELENNRKSFIENMNDYETLLKQSTMPTPNESQDKQ